MSVFRLKRAIPSWGGKPGDLVVFNPDPGAQTMLGLYRQLERTEADSLFDHLDSRALVRVVDGEEIESGVPAKGPADHDAPRVLQLVREERRTVRSRPAAVFQREHQA